MIHPLLNSLQEKTKAKFAKLKDVGYYKGEFEEGSQWNPTFPIVFFNAPFINPGLAGSEKWLKADVTINAYIGFKMENQEQTELFAEFLLWLNNLNDDADLKKEYTFDLKPATLQAYVAGVEAYKIELSVKKVIA